jgi:hypothetical protein
MLNFDRGSTVMSYVTDPAVTVDWITFVHTYQRAVWLYLVTVVVPLVLLGIVGLLSLYPAGLMAAFIGGSTWFEPAIEQHDEERCGGITSDEDGHIVLEAL